MKRATGIQWLVLVCVSASAIAGCAEGYFWKSGRYAPWVRDRWAAEERVADTLFKRKREMNEAVRAVANSGASAQQPVAERLAEIVNRDPVLLMRLHAIDLLTQLNNQAATDALRTATTDPDTDVRIAAVKAVGKLPANVAVNQLQEVIGSDTNIDVRLAATRALGNFQGQSAVNALSLALQDRDPALQIRATESLARATGQSMGRDVAAWQQYVDGHAPAMSNAPEQRFATEPKMQR